MLRRAVLFSSLICCSNADNTPALDHPATLGSQERWLELHAVWERAEPQSTNAFIESLEQQIALFPEDPGSRRLRAYLTLTLVEEQQFDRAEAIVTALGALDVGTTDDFVTIVRGALLRHRGKPLLAFRLLDPLFNRIVDVRARTKLNEELFLLAIELERFRDAATYLRALVTQAEGNLRLRAERIALAQAELIPNDVLIELLAAEIEAEQRDRWLLTYLAKHLAKAAVDPGDPVIARRLLELVPELVGADADALMRVAARGAEVRLERNTVGLVMPVGSDTLRGRGLDVARGLALSLGLPGGAAKLVVRDHRAGPEAIPDTLALLNADGAAVIVAGYDVADATEAHRYAKKTSVPIVLLTQPEDAVSDAESVFVLGEDAKIVRERLVGALATRGKKRVVILSDDRRVIDFSQPLAMNIVAEQPCSASIELLDSTKADAVVLDGDAACGARAAGLRGGGRLVGVGLRAATASADVFASAGLFPIPDADRKDVQDDPLWKLLVEERETVPSYWMALGHDAGLLVKDAILGLPPDSGDKSIAVAVRQRIVADAIANAEVQLWTTSAKGFAGGRVLPRDVLVTSRP